MINFNEIRYILSYFIGGEVNNIQIKKNNLNFFDLTQNLKHYVSSKKYTLALTPNIIPKLKLIFLNITIISDITSHDYKFNRRK